MFDLNVLYMSGYVISIPKMLIKLLQSRLYIINLHITLCIVGWHDLQKNVFFFNKQCTYLHATITSIHRDYGLEQKCRLLWREVVFFSVALRHIRDLVYGVRGSVYRDGDYQIRMFRIWHRDRQLDRSYDVMWAFNTHWPRERTFKS